MKRIHGMEGQPSSCTYACNSNVSFNSSPCSLSLDGDTTSPIYSSGSLSNMIYSDSNSTTVTDTPF